ncbi:MULTISPECIES: hypothetical protein [unclassified Streptomyces]|uniref:hypothetical protein n=1 Tax=Streptomyces sp. WAC 01420 TaxID=2203203 RepID=UPI000A983BBB|nr:hypothetical protein DLM49_07075 [Streptomyces sp. WAC 01438]RSM94141.1 hypothetical protein DMA10_19565 [Streptomyces sp. WAC 01420]
MNRDLPRTLPPVRTTPRGGLGRDLTAVGAAALLVLAAAVIGTYIQNRYGTLRVAWPPLVGDWMPHAGPGTPAALLVAAAVVAYGPALAVRLSWRRLLLAAWGVSLAWTWSLALVDGWSRGVAERLTTRHEYLRVIDRFGDIPAALRDFNGHILIGTPDNWPAHVAGHPPGATLTFVLLDRIGLGGGGWAGAFVLTAGTTAVAAILIAVRRLADESLARRAAPFLVLAPGAVWVGASADGYFTAVTAWAVALLALAVTGHRPAWTGFGSGLLFGMTMYLSYGLTLFAVTAAAVLLLGGRKLRPLAYAVAGFLVVPAVFTALGFDWWEAYRLLVTRYYQGAGGVRPYGYWVWANLACTVLVVGPATVAGLRRAGAVWAESRTPLPRSPAPRLALLVCSALLALLIADLSGMSKAETERIWLPFAFWLLPACALLPGPRGWLAGQAALALLLNHLVLTWW